MMCVCKYNPRRDIKRVVPNGALDLKAAFASGSIPADLHSDVSRYNGIDEPQGLHRVTDTIDAEMMSKQVREYKAPESNE